MIKLKVDESIIDEFYNGVKGYINKTIFTTDEYSYFTDKKIEQIIKCKPKDFESLSIEIEAQSLNQDIIRKTFVGEKGYNNGYKKFSSKDTTKNKIHYRAYSLSEKLNIDVCPYCNKNYTYTIVNKSKQYTRPDFDHFLAKEKYPYFALSFYNLIPSCQVCNRTLKHTIEFSLDNYIHPYQDDFNSIKKFTTNKPLVLCTNEDDFKIVFEDKSDNEILTEKANNNIKDLALELQYNKHKDIVIELKDKYDLYNDDSLQNILKDTNVFKKKGEKYIKSLIMGVNEKDENINKRPLSKLIKDISEELDLL
ncbi:MAG: hypothetical protein HWD90_09135 [Campylobacteraceae bacterium]|nr:hypothetical protein [Campylobacteraceae bacterium]